MSNSFTFRSRTLALASAALLCLTPLTATAKARHASSSKAKTAAAPAKSSASAKKSSVHAAHDSASTKTVAKSTARGRGVRKVSAPAPVAAKARPHGQQSIDSERTMEIQQALIREHYLDGEPTGSFDQATRDALTRFQNDNHWQTRIVPDSRALIKLGLGPSQQNLLNPETAAISAAPVRMGADTGSMGQTN